MVLSTKSLHPQSSLSGLQNRYYSPSSLLWRELGVSRNMTDPLVLCFLSFSCRDFTPETPKFWLSVGAWKMCIANQNIPGAAAGLQSMLWEPLAWFTYCPLQEFLPQHSECLLIQSQAEYSGRLSWTHKEAQYLLDHCGVQSWRELGSSAFRLLNKDNWASCTCHITRGLPLSATECHSLLHLQNHPAQWVSSDELLCPNLTRHYMNQNFWGIFFASSPGGSNKSPG